MRRRTLGLIGLFLAAAMCGLTSAASSPGDRLESVFEIPRPDQEDVIYFRNKDVLRGQVLNETGTVATQYGMLSVPLRKCAGISFEGARTNAEEVVLVNFSRITGILLDPVIRFRVGPSGTEISIRKEKIRFLVFAKRPDEMDFLKGQTKPDLFIMTNGDVLRGEVLEREVTVRADYGRMPVLFAEMKDLQMRGPEGVTAVITKTNGDTIHGTLETDEISLRLAIGSDLPAIYKDRFARILVGQAGTQALAQFNAPQLGFGESADAATAVPVSPDERATTLYLGKQVTLKLALIPAGKFLMGSPPEEAGRAEDEGPQRAVTISRPFYMGIHEVTQAQYMVIMGNNPARFKDAARPVETVSWEDAVEFCLRLSQRTGRKVTLPTEAQWEYACRAGSNTRFYFGNEEGQLGAYARYGQSGEAGTVPVGLGKPNAWGLYDMYGNITEWCSDWYAASYGNASAVDPAGPSLGPSRVIRGGCWGNPPAACRSAARKGFAPDSRNPYRGFRVVVGLN
jgi:formylglycine-generating enzyme required for sulfatase activity